MSDVDTVANALSIVHNHTSHQDFIFRHIARVLADEIKRLQIQNIEATKVIQQLSETIAFNNLKSENSNE